MRWETEGTGSMVEEQNGGGPWAEFESMRLRRLRGTVRVIAWENSKATILHDRMF